MEKNTYKHNILLTLPNKSHLFIDNDKKNDAKNSAACRIEPGSPASQSNAVTVTPVGFEILYVLQPYISEGNSYSCRSASNPIDSRSASHFDFTNIRKSWNQ